MTQTRQWRVDVFLYEGDSEVAADAVLHGDAPNPVTARGTARLRAAGSIPEIGAELATSRALSALSHRMLELASEDLAALPRSASAH
jgi:hypothetical protein